MDQRWRILKGSLKLYLQTKFQIVIKYSNFPICWRSTFGSGICTVPGTSLLGWKNISLLVQVPSACAILVKVPRPWQGPAQVLPGSTLLYEMYTLEVLYSASHGTCKSTVLCVKFDILLY